jgi:4-hydroxybenzoate polyprenyltransferase
MHRQVAPDDAAMRETDPVGGRVGVRVGVVALVRACHPEPSLAVTSLTTALAVSAGRGAGSGWVAAALLSGQLSIGWSNDWIDADRDRTAARSDKPAARGELSPTTVRTAAFAAAAACVPLSLAMGWRAGVLHLLAVAVAWAYNLRLKSTAASWLPFALAFGAIPSIVTLGLPGSPWAPAWATAAGALLGVGAHLANVLPDLADDAATGVRGLPHRLGARWSAALAAALLLSATALLVVGPKGSKVVALVALIGAAFVTAAGLVLGKQPGSRAPFRAAMIVAVVDVALLLAGGSSLA